MTFAMLLFNLGSKSFIGCGVRFSATYIYICIQMMFTSTLAHFIARTVFLAEFKVLHHLWCQIHLWTSSPFSVDRRLTNRAEEW